MGSARKLLLERLRDRRRLRSRLKSRDRSRSSRLFGGLALAVAGERREVYVKMESRCAADRRQAGEGGLALHWVLGGLLLLVLLNELVLERLLGLLLLRLKLLLLGSTLWLLVLLVVVRVLILSKREVVGVGSLCKVGIELLLRVLHRILRALGALRERLLRLQLLWLLCLLWLLLLKMRLLRVKCGKLPIGRGMCRSSSSLLGRRLAGEHDGEPGFKHERQSGKLEQRKKAFAVDSRRVEADEGKRLIRGKRDRKGNRKRRKNNRK